MLKVAHARKPRMFASCTPMGFAFAFFFTPDPRVSWQMPDIPSKNQPCVWSPVRQIPLPELLVSGQGSPPRPGRQPHLIRPRVAAMLLLHLECCPSLQLSGRTVSCVQSLLYSLQECSLPPLVVWRTVPWANEWINGVSGGPRYPCPELDVFISLSDTPFTSWEIRCQCGKWQTEDPIFVSVHKWCLFGCVFLFGMSYHLVTFFLVFTCGANDTFSFWKRVLTTEVCVPGDEFESKFSCWSLRWFSVAD